jgi:hypothetical protein
MLQSVAHVAVFGNGYSTWNGRTGMADGPRVLQRGPARSMFAGIFRRATWARGSHTCASQNLKSSRLSWKVFSPRSRRELKPRLASSRGFWRYMRCRIRIIRPTSGFLKSTPTRMRTRRIWKRRISGNSGSPRRPWSSPANSSTRFPLCWVRRRSDSVAGDLYQHGVPAKAGTHNHRALRIRRAVASASCNNEKRWLWVPAQGRDDEEINPPRS